MVVGPIAKKLEIQEGAWVCELSATQGILLGLASRLLYQFPHLEAGQEEESGGFQDRAVPK